MNFALRLQKNTITLINLVALNTSCQYNPQNHNSNTSFLYCHQNHELDLFHNCNHKSALAREECYQQQRTLCEASWCHGDHKGHSEQ